MRAVKLANFDSSLEVRKATLSADFWILSKDCGEENILTIPWTTVVKALVTSNSMSKSIPRLCLLVGFGFGLGLGRLGLGCGYLKAGILYCSVTWYRSVVKILRLYWTWRRFRARKWMFLLAPVHRPIFVVLCCMNAGENDQSSWGHWCLLRSCQYCQSLFVGHDLQIWNHVNWTRFANMKSC